MLTPKLETVILAALPCSNAYKTDEGQLATRRENIRRLEDPKQRIRQLLFPFTINRALFSLTSRPPRNFHYCQWAKPTCSLAIAFCNEVAAVSSSRRTYLRSTTN